MALNSLTPGILLHAHSPGVTVRKIGALLGELKKTLAQVQACKGLQVFIQVGGQVQESGPEGWLCQEPPESAVAPGTEGLGSE